MFEIEVQDTFDAAHRVVSYPGKCDRLHGHTWRVEVNAAGTELDELGMLVDFKGVRQKIQDVLGELDHQYLNELPMFKEHNINPTAENIAKYIYSAIKSSKVFDGERAVLKSVRVWESAHSAVRYSED